MTTIPATHFAIDPPGFNDRMELTPDHPDATENADDFDIDIDLMQDQEEPDDDVIVDDAFPVVQDQEEASGNISEPHHDADMLDEEITEAGPVENVPYDQYQEAFYQTDENYYDNNNTYEAEMVDDYEEEIDAAVPDNDGTEILTEPSEDIIHDHNEPQQPKSPKDEDNEGTTNSLGTAGIPDAETQQISSGENIETLGQQRKEVADQQPRSEHGGSDAHPQDIADQEYTDTAHHEHDEHHKSKTSADGGQADDAPERLEATEGVDEARTTANAANNEQDENEVLRDQAAEGVGQLPALPPIKILYQDNEISLFPPREGDSSEIFFLQDEGLASEGLSQLFKACRQVLGNHIGETEELVLDIYPLSLHLNEESPHIAEITLFQVVEVYLHLSHNDGVDEPEPLYITLSTKTTLLSDYSNLVTAAQDGHGLSYFNTGDNLEQEEAGENYDDENMPDSEDETREKGQPSDSGLAEGDGHSTNEKDEDHSEPQSTGAGHAEYADEQVPNVADDTYDELQTTDLEHAGYDEGYMQSTEDATTGELQPAGSETVGYDGEPVLSAEDGAHEEPQPVESETIQCDDGHLLDGEESGHEEQAVEPEYVGLHGEQTSAEDGSHQEPQPTVSELVDIEETEAANVSEWNQSNNRIEQPTQDFEDTNDSEALDSHPLSGNSAETPEYRTQDLEQGEEKQDEIQDEIDLGYGDESANAGSSNPLADIGENIEQEELRDDEPENPSSPKEDLFEYEDEDYESPGTLAQQSKTHSAVDQEFNLETDATGTHHGGFSIGEEKNEETVLGITEDQEAPHGDEAQDEAEFLDKDDQEDENINPNEESGLNPVTALSPESGECSPSPQAESSEPTVAQDDNVYPETGEVTNHISPHHKKQESVDSDLWKVGEELSARTPDPSGGLYEIDEDLFKSPAKDSSNNDNSLMAEVPDTTLTAGEAPVSATSSYPIHDPDEINFDDDDEDDENLKTVNLGISTDLGAQPSSQPHDNAPQSVKRSREDEDDINVPENSTPDVKRRRS